MAEENKKTKESKKPKVNKQRFIQNKLLVLNSKVGARYQRDADRVVHANVEVQ